MSRKVACWRESLLSYDVWKRARKWKRIFSQKTVNSFLLRPLLLFATASRVSWDNIWSWLWGFPLGFIGFFFGIHPKSEIQNVIILRYVLNNLQDKGDDLIQNYKRLWLKRGLLIIGLTEKISKIEKLMFFGEIFNAIAPNCSHILFWVLCKTLSIIDFQAKRYAKKWRFCWKLRACIL